MRNYVLLAVASVLVTGCASALNPAGSDKFDCPGMPQGVVCKNPREVYSRTEGDVSSVTADSLKTKEELPNDKIVKIKHAPGYNGPAFDQADHSIQPEPLVTQTQVLRIWIAPWVDKSNDLHWPGLMFTKIQKSEWNFGGDSFENVEPPVPHLIGPPLKTQDNSQNPQSGGGMGGGGMGGMGGSGSSF